MARKVDLPQPDGPVTATYSPRPMSSVTSDSAGFLIGIAAEHFGDALEADQRHRGFRGFRSRLTPGLWPPGHDFLGSIKPEGKRSTASSASPRGCLPPRGARAGAL